MNFQDIIDKYTDWIEFSKMKYNLVTWLSISLGVTFLTGILSYVLTALIIREFTMIPILKILWFLQHLVVPIGMERGEETHHATLDDVEKELIGINTRQYNPTLTGAEHLITEARKSWSEYNA